MKYHPNLARDSDNEVLLFDENTHTLTIKTDNVYQTTVFSVSVLYED